MYEFNQNNHNPFLLSDIPFFSSKQGKLTILYLSQNQLARLLQSKSTVHMGLLSTERLYLIPN
jgi:hypothetical protein